MTIPPVVLAAIVPLYFLFEKGLFTPFLIWFVIYCWLYCRRPTQKEKNE